MVSKKQMLWTIIFKGPAHPASRVFKESYSSLITKIRAFYCVLTLSIFSACYPVKSLPHFNDFYYPHCKYNNSKKGRYSSSFERGTRLSLRCWLTLGHLPDSFVNSFIQFLLKTAAPNTFITAVFYACVTDVNQHFLFPVLYPILFPAIILCWHYYC